MEIGLVYSSKDPQQLRTRDFLRKFLQDRGILANVVETEKSVPAPKITVDGCCISEDRRRKPRDRQSLRFISTEDIAKALEKTIWSL